MIHDLATAPEDVTADADVCIVGGGTAGLFLANRLRSVGLAVIILEAGGFDAVAPEACDQRCRQLGIPYRGAESGRSFGLGGTSVLWGGQMLSLTPQDVGPRLHAGFPAWPVAHTEIVSRIPEVLSTFGLPQTVPGDARDDQSAIDRHYGELRSFGPAFNLRLSAWLPFATRNCAHTFREMLKHDERTVAWIGAHVVAIDADSANAVRTVRQIVAKSASGRAIRVRARDFVLAAGALESIRLLLEYDEATQGSISSTGAPLGRHFSDHLSVTCGRFLCHDWNRFNSSVAPAFVQGIMRTPRLEISADSQAALSIASAYAHFTFLTHGDSGFDVVRNFLRSRQGEARSLGLSPGILGDVVHDVSCMAYWRYIKRKLWIPRQADALLQIDIEQQPNPLSRITLDSSRDSFGRRRLAIDWRVTDEDVRTLREAANLAADAWARSPLRESATLTLSPAATGDDFEALYDVYHPTGALRMGTDPGESVVDGNLRLWLTDNLHITTTAVFPSAGSANPGLVHLALTARLAETLIRRLR